MSENDKKFEVQGVRAVDEKWAMDALREIECRFEADVLFMCTSITPGVDRRVWNALNGMGDRRERLAVILTTGGGSVETTERIVTAMRSLYEEVWFLIPDVAMSAGTILTLSGDQIWMHPLACLGPIDPQVPRGDKLVPVAGYLDKYAEFVAKSQDGTLTTAELHLLRQMDLGELRMFELARDLSNMLIRDWLPKYKFRHWLVTEGEGKQVTDEMRRDRARDTAEKLNDHMMWGSHGRPIGVNRVRLDLGLKVEDLKPGTKNGDLVMEYFVFMLEYMNVHGYAEIVHSRIYF